MMPTREDNAARQRQAQQNANERKRIADKKKADAAQAKIDANNKAAAASNKAIDDAVAKFLVGRRTCTTSDRRGYLISNKCLTLSEIRNAVTKKLADEAKKAHDAAVKAQADADAEAQKAAKAQADADAKARRAKEDAAKIGANCAGGSRSDPFQGIYGKDRNGQVFCMPLVGPATFKPATKPTCKPGQRLSYNFGQYGCVPGSSLAVPTLPPTPQQQLAEGGSLNTAGSGGSLNTDVLSEPTISDQDAQQAEAEAIVPENASAGVKTAGMGGISPLMLVAGAAALYFFVFKKGK